jgi:hypothetical protein
LASATEAERALRAWDEALRRGRSMGEGRLLYEARFGRGVLQSSGTLAVIERGESLEATLAGPFGAIVARYGDGIFETEGTDPLPLSPEMLRAVLAGVWNAEAVRVEGCREDRCLLSFGDPSPAQLVLDVEGARALSLRVVRPEGEIRATYSGRFDPWPERVEAEEIRSGRKLRLRLLAREALGGAR